jgi:asparagine synthase (glutamine-hydrolysing)
MTALAGFWSFGSAEPPPRCARMLKSQALYGPDGAAQWDGRSISLGRRLFRILPEDAHDRGPVAGGDGRYTLIADLRLDNRDELGAALGLAAKDAAGLADSAMLMRCFERWGEDAVARLVGDFAFALWDEGKRELLLARDFLGQRPLHYHRGADFFAFASMPKGLHALAEVPYALDRTGMSEFLALLPETGSASFFEGVLRVEPGHLAIVDRDGMRSRRYWRPAPLSPGLPSFEDYAEALRQKMDEAVASRLRGSGGRVAAQLSAGLDSASVAATAARLLGPQSGSVVAFTAVPRAGYSGASLRRSIADEGPLAAATAALYPNMEHVRISAGGRSPLSGLDRNFFLYERPLRNICNSVWADAINDAARERGLRVLLTGQMGNMGLSWTGMTLLPELLGQGRLIRLAATAASLLRRGTRLGTIASQSLGPFLPRALWRAALRLRGKGGSLADYSLINPAAGVRSEIDRRAGERGLDLSYRPRASGAASRLWALGRVDFGNFNKGVLGGWGLDVRDPTADRRLIEFCLAVPEEHFLHGGVPRGLARAAMADRLPPEVTAERRKGYQGADWHEGFAEHVAEIRAEIERVAACPPGAEAIDAERLRALARNLPTGGWNAPGTIQLYRGALLRGVAAGHFIRKAAGANE